MSWQTPYRVESITRSARSIDYDRASELRRPLSPAEHNRRARFWRWTALILAVFWIALAIVVLG